MSKQNGKRTRRSHTRKFKAEAIEVAARREAMRIAALAVARRFNADHSDHAGHWLPCPSCKGRARYAGRRPKTFNLYDVMDSAYDAEEIKQYSRSLGHVPLIDINTRSNTARKQELEAEAQRLKRIGFQLPEDVRYNERTTIERVNGRFKDEFGGRHVRVRGAAKVMCHCMFGILALTADQLMRLIT